MICVYSTCTKCLLLYLTLTYFFFIIFKIFPSCVCVTVIIKTLDIVLNSSTSVVEVLAALEQYDKSDSGRLPPDTEKKLRMAYKRSVKTSPDPFKVCLVILSILILLCRLCMTLPVQLNFLPC